MYACQDALITIFKGHIVAAACKELGIDKPEDDIKEKEINKCLLKNVADKVVKQFTIISQSFLGKPVESTDDQVHNYARVLCHFASVVCLFIDAWKEGDGERVIRCWKLCMLHLHSERKTKYALEALRLQFQLRTLQPYLVHQLTWGRFVNTHGGKGRNIPCDLHNEHINKLFKEMIGDMGANFTEEASTRAARSISTLERLAIQYERQTGIHPQTTAHSRRSDEKDVFTIVKAVQKARVLDVVSKRSHSKFHAFSANPLRKLDREKMIKWIKKKAKDYIKRGNVMNAQDCDDDCDNDNDEEDNEEEDEDNESENDETDF